MLIKNKCMNGKLKDICTQHKHISYQKNITIKSKNINIKSDKFKLKLFYQNDGWICGVYQV